MKPYSTPPRLPPARWALLALAGGLVVVWVLIGISTWVGLERTRRLMVKAMETEAELVLRALEGSARAIARRGVWRRPLVEAVVADIVRSTDAVGLALVTRGGGVLGAVREGQGQVKLVGKGALEGLEPQVLEALTQGREVRVWGEEELVVGRAFRALAGGVWPRPGGWWMARECPEAARGVGRRGPYVVVRLSTAPMKVQLRAQAWQAVGLGVGLGLVAVGVAVAIGLWARTQQARLAEARHLAAVGGLAARVAHEVRNPLSSIKGLVELVARAVEKGSREQQLVDVILEELGRLERIVQQLLTYTRPAPPRIVEVDLGELARGCLELFRADPRMERLEVELDVPKDIGTVRADPDQLRQLLVNLLANALEAARTKVWIRARGGQGWVEISVDDDGSGVSEPEKVFEPFYTTTERGTGLGLAIARRIAHAHGGEITVGTSPAGGARFSLRLPRKGTAV